MLLTETDLQNDRLILLLSLARISFLTLQEKKNFANNIDSSSKLALMSIEEIENLAGRTIKNRIGWNGQANLMAAKLVLQRCKARNIGLVFYDDTEYPELLRQISDAPFLLFFRGNVSVLQERSVSIVGTRRITPDGKAAAIDFAYAATLDGCNVVSGLANGIDGCAHQGAINAFFDTDEKSGDCSILGKTIAVLPSAIDEIVPYGHKRMAEHILKTGGCIISEYEPGTPMANFHFVGRNRIIAGLSPATVVIEAPAGSGALITADFAVDYNRDVMIHQAAFGSLAEKVSATVVHELEKDFALGGVSKYKLENRPEKFIKDGAPIIKDYKDYCKALAEMPGTRSANIVQQKLFED
ncbi:MAG: DNA-processing protein DprA [Treponema sp.]|nr:DNA-processing protein DprA [Treponema sp.]